MNRSRNLIVAGAAVVALAVPAGTALAADVAKPKTTAFTASYAGRAVVRVTGDTSADITATGKGTGTLVGKSTLTGTGFGTQSDPCPSFGGTGFITASDGSKLNIAVQPGAKACPGAAEGDPNAVSGNVTVKGGTKKFAKAKGLLKLSGIYDRTKGTFSVKFAGKLTV
jgi:hypothetical protein